MPRILDMSSVETLARSLVEPSIRSSTSHLVIEVPSFQEARRCAQEPTQAFAVEPEVMDLLMNATGYEARLGWTDLREQMAGREFRGRSHTLHLRSEPDGFDSVWRCVDQILASHPEASEVSEDIAADLYHCALSRHLHGVGGGFWERLRFVYRHGYWPCGWRGTFPDVQFLGYRFPPAS